MFSKFTKNFNLVNPLAVIFLFLDVFIFLVVIYEKFYHHDNTKFTNKWSKYTYIIVCKILKKLLWLILLIACIFHVVLISIGKLSNPLNVSDAQMDILNMTNHEKRGIL